MPGNPLKVRRLYNLAPEVVRLQDSVAGPIEHLAKIPFLNGVLIEGVQLLTTPVNQINHGLGRKVRGWFPVSVSTNTRLWDELDSPDAYDLTKVLPLNTASVCFVSLWVF